MAPYLLPNLLTASRAAVAVAVLLDPVRAMVAWLIAWAALSDFLDGWLARRLGTDSRNGATFDLTVDGLFFLACFVGFWRTGVIPNGWFAAILAAVIPEVIAQAVFLLRRSGVGSPGRSWNRILGGYSYCCVAGLSLGGNVGWFVAPLVFLELVANGLDLKVALHGIEPRGPRTSSRGE